MPSTRSRKWHSRNLFGCRKDSESPNALLPKNSKSPRLPLFDLPIPHPLMAAPPPVLTLAVEKGPRTGETRQCRAGAALRVGRVVKGNDLAVRDVGASQQHLAIEFLPPPAARWAVSDLGSSNGTLLNGAPLVPSVPAPLSHGDLIKIGESTVLAVSIASDSDPNPSANPGPRRSSRHAAAVVPVVEEEKPPVVTRRGTRKKAAAVAEIPEEENEEPEAAAVAMEEEKPRAVTRRGGRKKAVAAELPEAEKEEIDEAARRGGRKKTADPREPEKEEEAVVVTHRGGRKKDAAMAGPPPLPPKTRSRRGRGRVTRTSARTTVLEEEEEEQEQEENEVAVPREQTWNPLSATAVNGDDEEKGDNVADGDGEIEGTAKALEEERATAQRAASDNGGEEEKGGGEEEEGGKREVVGSGGEVGDGEKTEEYDRKSRLETMTLREWFERMEKYLPRMINEAADEMIAALEDRHRHIDEYISTLEK